MSLVNGLDGRGDGGALLPDQPSGGAAQPDLRDAIQGDGERGGAVGEQGRDQHLPGIDGDDAILGFNAPSVIGVGGGHGGELQMKLLRLLPDGGDH